MNKTLIKQNSYIGAVAKELTLLKTLIRTDPEQAANLIEHMELKLNTIARLGEDLQDIETKRVEMQKNRRALGTLGTRS